MTHLAVNSAMGKEEMVGNEQLQTRGPVTVTHLAVNSAMGKEEMGRE